MKNDLTKAKAPRIYILLFIALFSLFYFLTQHLIMQSSTPKCFVIDKVQNALSYFNQIIFNNIKLGDKILIIDSLTGDLAVIFLLGLSIYQKSLRPLLGLFFYIFLRQSFQFLTSYPPAEQLIWHNPGFPSLFVTYDIEHDFYFSAYVGITLLAALEFLSFKRLWIKVVAFIPFIYQVFSDLVTRSHFIMDIYTAIVTAIAVDMLAKKIDKIFDKRKLILSDSKKRLGLILLMISGISLYFIVQNKIGTLSVPLCGIKDQILEWFSTINAYLVEHPSMGNFVLIYSSMIIDILTLYICSKSIIKRDVGPALTFILFFTFRQFVQLLVALPMPEGIIWRDPGFPSLLQTYHIGNDLYFSGHTGTSLIGLIELSRHRLAWLTGIGYLFFFSIIFSIAALRIHYTMDVYTAIMTVFCVTALSKYCAPYINRFFEHFNKTLKAFFIKEKQ